MLHWAGWCACKDFFFPSSETSVVGSTSSSTSLLCGWIDYIKRRWTWRRKMAAGELLPAPTSPSSCDWCLEAPWALDSCSRLLPCAFLPWSSDRVECRQVTKGGVGAHTWEKPLTICHARKEQEPSPPGQKHGRLPRSHAKPGNTGNTEDNIAAYIWKSAVNSMDQKGAETPKCPPMSLRLSYSVWQQQTSVPSVQEMEVTQVANIGTHQIFGGKTK
jgi:hypothetical protein